MAHYQIIQKGWVGYTGSIGQVFFKDGVTVEEYPDVFIDRVAAGFQLINVDTGSFAGAAQRQVDARSIPAEAAAKLEQMTQEQIDAANAAAVAKVSKTLHPGKTFTYDDLETIVDAKGINGLREIAAPFGVKAKSITDLMKAILGAQELLQKTRAAQAPAPVPAPAPVIEPLVIDQPPVVLPPVVQQG